MKSVVVDGSYTHTVNIPDEWEFSELKNVINLVGGNQPPKSKFLYEASDDTIRLIQIRDYKSDQHKVFIQKSDAKRFVNKTDVMIGRYGPPIFQILRGLEGAYNVALMKAEPVLGSYDKDFLYYYLSNQDIYNYVNSASDRTAGQSGVNKEHLEKYPVPVVPLVEQQEIVRQLDSMLAQVEQIKARLDAIPAILKKFRQSVLADGVSGKLFGEENHLNFENNQLKDLTLKIGSGSTPKGGNNAYQDEGIPFVRSLNIHTTYIKYKDLAFINEEQAAKLKNVEIKEDDILLNITGASIGRVNITPKEFIGGRVNQHVAIIRCDQEKIISKYLHIYLASPPLQKWIEGENYGATRQALTKGMLDSLVVKFPPLDFQKQIVQQVEKLFKNAETIEVLVQSAQKRVNLLTQSILAKAFRGELTAEWREKHQDLITGLNSAEALLAKIQEEREASKPVKKTRKRTEA